MRYKVYLAKLKRTNAFPRTVYKVGITSYDDAMNRINYRGKDEQFPITNYFTDNKIMASTRKIYTEDEAKAIEARIMDTTKGNDRCFHNWYEPDQISGITEMRKWNYNEVQKVFKLLND